MSQTWMLSFEIKQISNFSEWTSIVHFTNKLTNGRGLGHRIPAFFLKPSECIVHVCHYVSRRFCKDLSIGCNVFTNITLTQTLNVNKEAVYRIMLNGETKHSIVNPTAQRFENIKVYAGNPWFEPANAVLRNFLFDNIDE